MDKEKKLDILIAAALKGDPKALYELGYWYMDENYPEKAVTCYIKAAELGYADAQMDLSSCYLYGVGTNKNLMQSIKWVKKACEQGHIPALYNLGIFYRDGVGLEKNLSHAKKCFEYTAERGHINGQINLGVCFYNGEGVEKDYKQAAYWFRQAADQGNADAAYKLGLCYLYGNGVEESPLQAITWFRKIAGKYHGNNSYGLPSNSDFCDIEDEFQEFEEMVFWGQFKENTVIETLTNYPSRKDAVSAGIYAALTYMNGRITVLSELEAKYPNELRVTALVKRHAICGEQLMTLYNKINSL